MFTDHKGNETEIESNKYWNVSWPIQNELTIDVRNVTDEFLNSLTGHYSVKVYHSIDQTSFNFTVELSKAKNMETDTGLGEAIIIAIALAIFGFIIMVVVICCCFRKKKRFGEYIVITFRKKQTNGT